MDRKWELRQDYYVQNAFEFLSKINNNFHNYNLALKATPVVASRNLDKDKISNIKNQLIKAHGSDLKIIQRCLNLDSSPESDFNLVEYNEQKDNYRIRIWHLVDIDSDEYLDLRILRL